MTEEAVFQKVQQLMVDLFDLDAAKVTREAKFEDLDLTSLDAIDLVVELQQFIGKKVDEEGLKRVRTVGDIVALVQANLPKQDSPAA